MRAAVASLESTKARVSTIAALQEWRVKTAQAYIRPSARSSERPASK